jgi:predicted glycosyltransferase involved in capsule biosynthesis
MVQFLSNKPPNSIASYTYTFEIYIIQQSNDNRKFNRGKLLNIGYDIARRNDCNLFVFHDVDLLPSEELLKYYYYTQHVSVPDPQLIHTISTINNNNSNTSTAPTHQPQSQQQQQSLKPGGNSLVTTTFTSASTTADTNPVIGNIKSPLHIAKLWNRYTNNPSYFGGIVLFTANVFESINGFPNNFWGWGGEDDEIFRRVKQKGLVIDVPKPNEGKPCTYC